MSHAPTKLVLIEARRLIADEKDWLQHDWKTSQEGRTRRCAYQAIEDAATSLGLPATATLDHLMHFIGEPFEPPREVIPAFNDLAQHADVLELFDVAIEQA